MEISRVGNPTHTLGSPTLRPAPPAPPTGDRTAGSAPAKAPGPSGGASQAPLADVAARMAEVSQTLGRLAASVADRAAPPGPAIRQAVSAIAPPETPPGVAIKEEGVKQAAPGQQIQDKVVNILKSKLP